MSSISDEGVDTFLMAGPIRGVVPVTVDLYV